MIPCRVHRVAIARFHIDFRKQLNGLLAASYALALDPYRGDCIVFIKKDKTQLRALMGDSLGLYLVTRRFDGGYLKSHLPFLDDIKFTDITMAELSMLFDGAHFTIHRRVRPWRKPDKT